MTEIRQFRDIIYLWPTIADYGRAIGIDEGHAQTMCGRNSIPSKYWHATIEAAAGMGIATLDYETLAKCAAKNVKKRKKKKTS